jgi:hypothetical protein
LGNIWKPLVLIGKQHNALKTNGWGFGVSSLRMLEFLIRCCAQFCQSELLR